MFYRSGLRSLPTGPFSRFSNRTAVRPRWLGRPRMRSALTNKPTNPLPQSAHNQLARHACASSSSRNALIPLARQPFGIELCGKVARLLNRNSVENLLWGSHLMATYTVPVLTQVRTHPLNALNYSCGMELLTKDSSGTCLCDSEKPVSHSYRLTRSGRPPVMSRHKLLLESLARDSMAALQ